MHLLSSEAYIPTGGSGEVHTLSRDGFRIFPLTLGEIVWFEPGVIHRLVNISGDLELLVIMQNAGLPEAGDAVFTFPSEIMTSADWYHRASSLPDGTPETKVAAARTRRDLAIEGFQDLIAAPSLDLALSQFHARAIELRRDRFDQWQQLLTAGPLDESRRTLQQLTELVDGDSSSLGRARLAGTDTEMQQPVVGMCGLLRQYEPVNE